MKHASSYVVMLCLLTAALPASAANRLIAVLPLDVRHTKGKLDADAQASLEEMLRDVAINTLRPYGWTVLSDENTLQVLKDNGVDPSKCGNESCHLSMAREIKTQAFISGTVQYVDREFTASIRLIDTTTGSILASALVTGKTVTKLLDRFEAKAHDFFVRGGLLGNAAPPPDAQAGSERPPPPVDISPQVISGKESQAWGRLTITAKPSEQVRLELTAPDGKSQAYGAPYQNAKAMPGRWSAVARATGYEEQQQEFDVPADDDTLIEFELQPLGGLAVEGQPRDAKVVVDGPGGFHNEGRLPWEARWLKSGTYQVKLSRPGYVDESELATVSPGNRAVVNVQLQKGEDGKWKAKVEPKSGLEFVSLPEGTFHYGCEPGDSHCLENEKPGREVTVGPFWLARTEVTVEAYAKCVNAGACTAPRTGSSCNWQVKGKEKHPINCLDWNQAKSFCEWIGGRLPTAEEWEYAAKGGESRIYPWGNAAPESNTACFADTCSGGTAPAESYSQAASRHGLLNMAGNVAEWTASDYDQDNKELRGGAWNFSWTYLRTSARTKTAPDNWNDNVGARCRLH